jgi:hypothetical protein
LPQKPVFAHGPDQLPGVSAANHDGFGLFNGFDRIICTMNAFHRMPDLSKPFGYFLFIFVVRKCDGCIWDEDAMNWFLAQETEDFVLRIIQIRFTRHGGIANE